MKLPNWTHSLKWRIVASYSLILIVGGVSTSVIGIHVTGSALHHQARQQADQGLFTARTIYLGRLDGLRQCVVLLATGDILPHTLDGDYPHTATVDYLTGIRRDNRLDFLSVVDATGRVILRTAGPGTVGDVVADPTGKIVPSLAPVVRALGGRLAASTELVPLVLLRAEDPQLAERAAVALVRDGPVQPVGEQRLEAGMVLLAAAPVSDPAGRVIGAVYAGQLLNESDTNAESRGMIDQIQDALFPSLRLQGRHAGAATVFQGGVRVSTNVMTAGGSRAIGTSISREVGDIVLRDGQTWSGRTFAVSDWYIAACEPITNLAGERIGILDVGLLERPYTAVRDNVTLIFAAIALFCFVLIVVVTYFLTRSLVRPLEAMVAVSQRIAGGDLSHRLAISDQSELGELAGSFNAMLDRINEMNVQRLSLLEQDTQQWTQALEQRVRARTEQLKKTQAAMDRHQRLASLGQLAAGVAHEINNPLGGILTFASLVLEDLPADSPLRPDIEQIVTQADRCRRIVQELLEFSRQREASTVPRNINDVVARTLAMLEKQSSFQNIRIVREFDDALPLAVVDESQMQQVFMNIFLNAAHAMNERGTLTIRTGHAPDSREVFVRITDTGCGIPGDLREAIFDPFFTTKEPGKGTGLGLAVVCRIVQAHGGRLEVDSEVGQGTTFTVVLPLPTEVPAGERPA